MTVLVCGRVNENGFSRAGKSRRATTPWLAVFSFCTTVEVSLGCSSNTRVPVACRLLVRVLSSSLPHSVAKINVPEPTPKDLMNLVKTDQPIKLGQQLCVENSDLALVKKDHPNDHGQQLSDVLSLYMRQSLKPSWEEVTTALWSIGEKRTAKTIADKYGMVFSKCSSMHQMSYMNMMPFAE